MKTALVLLTTALVYQVAECGVGNMLADKVITRMSSWIKTEGPSWVTLSGHFEKGAVQGQTNNNYTLALAGPSFNLDGSLSRTAEANLTDVAPDPNYDSHQLLVFTVAIKNVTVNYEHIAYNDDNNGFYNVTSMGTSDGISTVVTLDLKGSGDSCMGFTNQVAVSFSGSSYITTNGTTKETALQVTTAVTTHFTSNVPNAIGLLVEAAVFNSLDGFDICTGVFNPLPEANVMARRLINAMQEGLDQNIQDWAILPGFWKTDTDLNGTTMDEVVVRVGNFSSIGSLTKNGDASYGYSANGNSQFTYLNMDFETDTVTAVYDHVLYTANTVQYQLAVRVDAMKMTTSMSFTFYQDAGASKPSCAGNSLGAVVTYEGGNVEVTSLTPNVPIDVLERISQVVSDGFLHNVGGAGEDLFIAAGTYAQTQECR